MNQTNLLFKVIITVKEKRGKFVRTKKMNLQQSNIKIKWHKTHKHPRGMLGKHQTNYQKKIRSKMSIKNNPMKYKKYRDKVSVSKIGKLRPRSMYTKKFKKNISIRMKKLWESPKYRKMFSTSKFLSKRPTQYEKRVIYLCKKYKLPFKYVGNNKFWIGSKNPDFIHKTKKIIIEVFANYWKPYNYYWIRRYYFSKYGYKTIFIDENNLYRRNWENICFNKINRVIK